jgi:hypothetical protein
MCMLIVYALTSYVHTVCILAAYMHMVYMHTEYIPYTGTYGIKRIAYIAHMHMANTSRACISCTCIQCTKYLYLKL